MYLFIIHSLSIYSFIYLYIYLFIYLFIDTFFQEQPSPWLKPTWGYFSTRKCQADVAAMDVGGLSLYQLTTTL